MENLLFVVYLNNVPIFVSSQLSMATREAAERTTSRSRAFVLAVRPQYWVGASPAGFFTDFDEEPTDPRCTPCAHGFACDDEWKPSRG